MQPRGTLLRQSIRGGKFVGAILAAAHSVAAVPVKPWQTGMVMGITAASLSLRPSLMPRTDTSQTAITAGSYGLGFAVGAGLNHTLNGISKASLGFGGREITEAAAAVRKTHIRLGFVGAGAAIGLLASRMDKFSGKSPHADALESAGRAVFVAGAGSIGAQVHGAIVNHFAHTPKSASRLSWIMAGAELAALVGFLEVRRQQHERVNWQTPSASTVFKAEAAVGAGYLLVKGEQSLAKNIITRLVGAPKWRVHGVIAGLAGAVGVGALWWKYHNQPPAPPAPELSSPLPTVSGADVAAGAGDRHEDSLDGPGIEFLQGAVPKAEIARVMGAAVADPIRVAVGLKSAPKPEQRAELAFNRLKELGGFDRAYLAVEIPSGSGDINDQVSAPAEYFAKGDIASVLLPYSDRASVLSLDRVDDGAATTRRFLELVKEERDRRAAAGQPNPQVVMYGLSLGAWAGQESHKHEGVAGFDPLVDRALWIGSPGPSSWRQEVLFSDKPKYQQGRERVFEFSDLSELEQLTPEQRSQYDFYLHSHATDPVVHVDSTMFYRRPLWLEGEHRGTAKTPEYYGFVPGVSFLQELGDSIAAAASEHDPKFQSDAHNYTTAMPADIRHAWFPNEFSDDDQAKVEAALRQHQGRQRAWRDTGEAPYGS